VPHLEPYPHHRGPLDVVGLGEGRPPAVGTDVPDNGLVPMVTMVPARGGRAAPPIKATISVNPVTGASAPVRAAAMAPLGVRGCPLRRLLPRCLPRQLELVVSVVVGRNRAAGATSVQSLELYRRRTRCIRRCRCSAIASLAALADVATVSAAARSRSSAATISTSCRCYALEATER
jgi:hypothetical protein